MAQLSAADKLRIEKRRAVTAKELLKGSTYRKISTVTGVALATVKKDVDAVLAEYRAQQVIDVKKATALELARLDVITTMAMFKVEKKKDINAAHLLLRVSERRARLLGLDQPLAVDHTTKGKPLSALTEELSRADKMAILQNAAESMLNITPHAIPKPDADETEK